ncbi:hypothetical protein NLX86_11155 [Streptomyces sp. A3M-1-3]|uniref:VMAP-C domain-containing protein n=1 Tax=Streptomyces sp. A3M-1-3 TaxID=2962044 RepID=UPI0020B7693F|nr:hypothetical protein [Streptomyces sp. A3M-1-3]MCP3818657.1 hypothetical protein [Streptomyces sp. A3M-1-3]
MTAARRGLPRYLVDAVTEVGCLQDLDTLRQLVHRLGRESRSALDSTTGTSQRGLVVQLMEELCERPAGLASLVENLEMRAGNSVAIRKLKVATAAWEVELLDNEEWDELFGLLEGVRIPDLYRRYSEFLHAGGRLVAPVHCVEPWAVFLHAATLSARPGEPLPCFQVLQQLLALGAEGVLQLEIIEWAQDHDPFRPAEQPPAPPVEKDPGAERTDVWSPSDYLIIRLCPLLDSGPGSDTLLSHWRRAHPGEQLRGTDRRIDLRNAEREVQALIREAESEWAYFLKSDLALEFMLPRDLLDLRVERWRKASFQGVGAVLGEDHQVVVRSLDRLNHRDLHGRWGRRWDAFTEGNAGRVHWFPEDGRRHLLSDPPPAVVVLSEPPGGARGEQRAHGYLDELGEALRAGVPVVLWDRRAGNDPAFRTALRSLLGLHDPRELPGVVKALRIASSDRDPEEDLVVGRHIALLWDDPSRMPVATAGTSAVPATTGEESP